MPRAVGYAKHARTVVVRNVDADVVNALAAEAAKEQRSLAAHVRFILARHLEMVAANGDSGNARSQTAG